MAVALTGLLDDLRVLPDRGQAFSEFRHPLRHGGVAARSVPCSAKASSTGRR